MQYFNLNDQYTGADSKDLAERYTARDLCYSASYCTSRKSVGTIIAGGFPDPAIKINLWSMSHSNCLGSSDPAVLYCTASICRVLAVWQTVHYRGIVVIYDDFHAVLFQNVQWTKYCVLRVDVNFTTVVALTFMHPLYESTYFVLDLRNFYFLLEFT